MPDGPVDHDRPAPPPGHAVPVPSLDIHPRDLIVGLEKGLAVILCFDADRPRLTISEVAQRTALTRAAARRYLLTLAHLGYMVSDGKTFSLSPKVLRLGQSFIQSSRLARIVQPQVFRTAHALREACSVGILDGDDVTNVAVTTADRVVSLTLQPGTRVPAWCTANGRVLIAALTQAEIDAWLVRLSPEPYTPKTITHKERLRVEVAKARAQGYAIVDQELEVGLRTIAVPLRNARGDTVASMNVSVHSARMSLDDMRDQYLPALLQAQAQMRGML